MSRLITAVATAGAILLTSTLAAAFSIGKVEDINVPLPRVHQDLIQQALSKNEDGVVVVTQTYGNLVFSPQAIEEILSNNVEADRYQGVPEYHFDDSAIHDASAYLKSLRDRIVGKLNGNATLANASEIRYLIGTATHTLQDFYSHTNWVDQNGSINKDLGEKVLPTLLTPFACSGTEANAPNLSRDIITSDLISGWAIGGKVGLVIGLVPYPGACAHGLVTNGIHKDWHDSLFRPGYGKARAMALEATKYFVFERILNEAAKNPANDRLICMVMTPEEACTPEGTFTRSFSLGDESRELYVLADGVISGTRERWIIGTAERIVMRINAQVIPEVPPIENIIGQVRGTGTYVFTNRDGATSSASFAVFAGVMDRLPVGRLRFWWTGNVSNPYTYSTISGLACTPGPSTPECGD